MAATIEEQNKIPERYQEFESIFNEPEGYLPEHAEWDCEINLEPGKQPTWSGVYKTTEKEADIIKEYIKTNLKRGYIRPSSSSTAHGVTFADKKDDPELRFCVDFRKTNDITIKDRYPLPRIDELQDELRLAAIYTKLDIKNAYHQIRMKEGEEWKTAFQTKFGLFEYNVMPFGLTNAPAVFQRRINTVLRECLGEYAMAYLDDIIIYSEKEEDHPEHVKEVLRQIIEAKLYLKLRKCEFHIKATTYLGFIIEPGKLKIEPRKVKRIQD